MLGKALSILTKMLMAIMLVIQRDIDGGPLINVDAHLGIGLVAIALMLWSICEVIYELARADAEGEADIAALRAARRRPIIYDGPNRNDYASREFNELFENEGSFSSLLERHR